MIKRTFEGLALVWDDGEENEISKISKNQQFVGFFLKIVTKITFICVDANIIQPTISKKCKTQPICKKNLEKCFCPKLNICPKVWSFRRKKIEGETKKIEKYRNENQSKVKFWKGIEPDSFDLNVLGRTTVLCPRGSCFEYLLNS